MKNNVYYNQIPNSNSVRAIINCGRKATVTIPSTIDKNNVEYLVEEIGDRAFCGTTLISEIEFPSTLRSIGKGAFSGQNIEHVVIPDSVTSIGADAFADNPICTIKIGKNVSSIGDFAFYNHIIDSKIRVTCFATCPIKINKKVFADTNLSKSILYIPKESLKLYFETEVWKEFGEIKAI